MEKTIVNWGVISCAGIADSAVIPGIKAAKNAKLHAISSRSPDKLEEFKKKHNPEKAYESYEELLEDPEIDAVYIPLPNGLHHEWAIKAALKKKHILCEKPLGINSQEVVSMKEACEKNGVSLMEAFAFRHSPLTLKVKSLVESGVIGKLKFIESHFSFLLKDLNNVRLDKNLAGGSIFDVGCYNINIIRYIAGSEPVSIQVDGEIGEKSGVDESCCILMKFENGLSAVSYCSFNCAGRSEYKIVGEAGIIEVPLQFNFKGNAGIILKKDNSKEEIYVDCPDNYMLEVEQFGKCILEGQKPLITFEDSYGNAQVIETALNKLFNKNEAKRWAPTPPR
jgi:D-xylose 1-dehydrogenase (NADP+, D-xylono-1,5-lactone-forming)